MPRRFAIIVILLLLLATAAHAENVGLIPDNRLAASDNSTRWSRANAAGKIVTVPLGTIYIGETITTRPVDGCARFESAGAGGCTVGGHPTLTGARSRVVMLGKGPSVRLSGSGAIAEQPIEWVGDGESAIFEVEGRDSPPSGRHRFKNQVCVDAGAAIKCLAGYYDATGNFVPCETHGDLSIVDGCETFNCDRLFWSQNQQSVIWKFRDCVVNVLGPKDCVVADLERGGHVTFDGLTICHPRTTLFKLRDFSPNNCRLVCRDMHVDRSTQTDFHCTLVDYSGPPYEWPIHIDGFIATYLTAFDTTKLYRVPANMPREDWRVELDGMK